MTPASGTPIGRSAGKAMQHCLIPVRLTSRPCPDSKCRKTMSCRKSSVPVDERSSQNVAAVGRSSHEAVQNGQLSRRTELVQDPPLAAPPLQSRHRGPLGIHQKARIRRILPVIRRACEGVQNAVFPVAPILNSTPAFDVPPCEALHRIGPPCPQANLPSA